MELDELLRQLALARALLGRAIRLVETIETAIALKRKEHPTWHG